MMMSEIEREREIDILKNTRCTKKNNNRKKNCPKKKQATSLNGSRNGAIMTNS